jgi:hypothetical protein
MRWPWSRGAAAGGDAARLTPLDRIDIEGLADLEVLELDDYGRRLGPPEMLPPASIRELGYSTASDGTGVAGLWRVLAER